jgi:hypothetical protein
MPDSSATMWLSGNRFDLVIWALWLQAPANLPVRALSGLGSSSGM